MGFLVGSVNPWFWRGRGNLGKGVWGSVWTLPCGIMPIQNLSEPPDVDYRNALHSPIQQVGAPRPRELSIGCQGVRWGPRP